MTLVHKQTRHDFLSNLYPSVSEDFIVLFDVEIWNTGWPNKTVREKGNQHQLTNVTD